MSTNMGKQASVHLRRHICIFFFNLTRRSSWLCEAGSLSCRAGHKKTKEDSAGENGGNGEQMGIMRGFFIVCCKCQGVSIPSWLCDVGRRVVAYLGIVFPSTSKVMSTPSGALPKYHVQVLVKE